MKFTTKTSSLAVNICEQCPAYVEKEKHPHDLNPDTECSFYDKKIEINWTENKPDFCKVKIVKIKTVYFEDLK